MRDEGPEGQSAGAPRRALRIRSLWGLHLLVVVALTALFGVLVATTPPDAGANIGAGLVGLPLLLLGLPWSLPELIDPYRFDDVSDVAHYVISFGPAFANVALHAAVLVLTSRRRR